MRKIEMQPQRILQMHDDRFVQQTLELKIPTDGEEDPVKKSGRLRTIFNMHRASWKEWGRILQ